MLVRSDTDKYCYLNIVVSHSHRLNGCYVWYETDKDTGKPRGWHAWSETPHKHTGWGYTPAEAVRSFLRLWRDYLLEDRKERFGTYSEKAIAKMAGWKLRRICRKRGLPVSRRLEDMRSQLRSGQKSLMSLFE